MAHSYTRQRQGRDFSILNALAAAEMSVEANYNNIDDSASKKTMLEQLEYLQAVAERNAAPIDGNEPQERGR
jgi:hypothetical protein